MSRLIDADRLQMCIADMQLSAAPDERDSKEVQAECRKAVADLEYISELINKQPTVSLHEWIPCSEKLPEPSLNSVIGWDEYRDRPVFVHFYNKRWILGNDVPVRILAWMPLPEAYE